MRTARALRWAITLGSLSAALSVTPVASADSSPWHLLQSDHARRAEQLYRYADGERIPREELLQGPRGTRLHHQRAAVHLKLAGAEALEHAGLQYLLAHCLANGTGELYPQARAALERALSLAPGHPVAAEAWYDLGNALELEGALSEADTAYTAALTLEWDTETRASIYRARAQLSMALGRLPQATEDYRAALEHSRDPKLRALSKWGLAVALDRSYDFPAAAPLALSAYHSRFNAGRRSVLDLEDGILWPPAEEHYYRGLALLAEAKSKQGGEGYVSTLLASQLMWMRYLEDSAEDDRWAPRAKAHLATVRRLVAATSVDDEADDLIGPPLSL